MFLGTSRIVRADCGTENVVVAGLQRFFCSQATDDFAGNKSFLYGKSSANQVVMSCTHSVQGVLLERRYKLSTCPFYPFLTSVA